MPAYGLVSTAKRIAFFGYVMLNIMLLQITPSGFYFIFGMGMRVILYMSIACCLVFFLMLLFLANVYNIGFPQYVPNKEINIIKLLASY